MAQGQKTAAVMTAAGGLFSAFGYDAAGMMDKAGKMASGIRVPAGASADAQAALARPADLGVETLAPNANGGIRAKPGADTIVAKIKANPWVLVGVAALAVLILWKRG